MSNADSKVTPDAESGTTGPTNTDLATTDSTATDLTKETFGEAGEKQAFYVTGRGGLYPASTLSRPAARRLETARLEGKPVTVAWTDGGQSRAQLHKSGLGLAGNVCLTVPGRKGALDLRHPTVKEVSLGGEVVFTSTG